MEFYLSIEQILCAKDRCKCQRSRDERGEMRFLEAYILMKRGEEELLLLDLVIQGFKVCHHQEVHPEDEAQIHKCRNEKCSHTWCHGLRFQTNLSDFTQIAGLFCCCCGTFVLVSHQIALCCSLSRFEMVFWCLK